MYSLAIEVAEIGKLGIGVGREKFGSATTKAEWYADAVSSRLARTDPNHADARRQTTVRSTLLWPLQQTSQQPSATVANCKHDLAGTKTVSANYYLVSMSKSANLAGE